MNCYQIGDIYFCWSKENFSLEQDKYMERFQIAESVSNLNSEKIIYESRMSSFEEFQNAEYIEYNETYELYKTKKGLFIVYHWATCRFGFGYWLNDLEKGNIVRCYFNYDMRNQIPLSTMRFFSCAGMHSKLLQRGGMILHASYIDWKGKGILFTAPSRTGKSTQAALWEQYAGAEIINGDRVLLRKKEDRWHSYGYPCCGSSQICINRTVPLSMIVVLEQGKENQIIPLSLGKKVRALVSGIEVFTWSSREIGLAFHLAEELVSEIPVIKLVCRPDEDAVNTLKKYWEEMYGKSI